MPRSQKPSRKAAANAAAAATAAAAARGNSPATQANRGKAAAAFHRRAAAATARAEAAVRRDAEERAAAAATAAREEQERLAAEQEEQERLEEEEREEEERQRDEIPQRPTWMNQPFPRPAGNVNPTDRVKKAYLDWLENVNLDELDFPYEDDEDTVVDRRGESIYWQHLTHDSKWDWQQQQLANITPDFNLRSLLRSERGLIWTSDTWT